MSACMFKRLLALRFPLSLSSRGAVVASHTTRLFSSSPSKASNANAVRFSQSGIVPYSPKQMYDIIQDVNKYSEFLPWITQSEVLAVHSCSGNGAAAQPLPAPAPTKTMTAKLTVGFGKFISVSYVSLVSLYPHRKIIVNVQKDDVFDFLDTVWQFDPVPNSSNNCNLSFHCEYAMHSNLYANLAHKFFSDISAKTRTAFISRADLLYNTHMLLHKIK